ncbi:MAG: polysaccharide pyruvyl transferase family protein [Prevotella sp.]|nr:polysaccharide pyruvyl transferase family protein [Prevotella sp.]
MQYKLLSVSKTSKLKGVVNIGDYIQALASSQYLPQIDGFVDRDEELKDYHDEPTAVIMNGWYMHNPKNWPPSEDIIPLFVAFHLNVLAKKEMTSPESIAYLKRHEPVGCRDMATMELLKSHGIEAYFSACMTLTLGKKFHDGNKNGNTYIVDPPFSVDFTCVNLVRSLCHGICYWADIRKIWKYKLLFPHSKNFIKRFIKLSLYHKEYSRVFGRDVISNSIYISQENSQYGAGLPDDAERLKEAERLVLSYAKAKMVITSRIHCALPCLGLGTPVIYIEKQQDIEASKCRLNGLKDLFNIVKLDGNQLKPDFETSLPVNPGNCPPNKDDYKKYAEALDKRCSEFISATQK